MKLHDLPTPSLVIHGDTFRHNITTMAQARPGPALRPHVKAFKSTALARELAALGHRTFCCATVREMVGMAGAGLGDDLLLANETLAAEPLGEIDARVTVAVDSETTVDAAVAAGVREVLVDVDVGLPRCGIPADRAGALADYARAQGLEVRGVMGYEGHAMICDQVSDRQAVVDEAMGTLALAHDAVGGEVVSAGGTGTYALHPDRTTEIQAGSYTLMDTAYMQLTDLPFRQALCLWTTVISVSESWAVCDGGLKSLGMDHGNPAMDHADVMLVSDEHITFVPHEDHPVQVGDRVRVWPAHVDPTVAYHERMYVVDGAGPESEPDDDASVIDTFEVDLRNW